MDATQRGDLAYSCPRVKDFTLDDNLSNLSVPSNNDEICKLPQADLGMLDVLPLELLHDLLYELDLGNLAAFLRANRRAMKVVRSIPQYRAMITHAPNALLGILSIGAGRLISVKALYDKFCTAECEECGDFAGHLYILTCKRVCFLCFSENERYLPLQYSQAIRKFGVDRQILSAFPFMKSIPGTYSPNEKKCRERITLVDSESAHRAGLTLHGSASAMEEYTSNMAARKLHEFEMRASQATTEGRGSSTRRHRRSRGEEAFDGRSGNPIRFMAVVRMAWFNKSTQELDRGFHCIGCQSCNIDRPLHWRRKFQETSFDEHLRRCGAIRDGKHHTE